MMSKNGYDEEWERVTSDEKELLKQYRKNKKSEKKYLQTQSLSLEKMLAKQTRIEKDGSTKLTDEAFIVRSTSSTLALFYQASTPHQYRSGVDFFKYHLRRNTAARFL